VRQSWTVEGAEREIFSTCNWINRVMLLAIELHDRDCPGSSEAGNLAGFEGEDFDYAGLPGFDVQDLFGK
jgi:hypothetical protein